MYFDVNYSNIRQIDDCRLKSAPTKQGNIMLLAFITPIDIGLSIGFISSFAGSIWFCFKNYGIENKDSDQSQQGAVK
jgi:hypothetical protein